MSVFFHRYQPSGFLVALAILIFAGMTGCDGEAPATSETYRVRGVIESLPEADNPASELRIHHEAIPNFVGADGKIVGMNAMTMPFTPATGLPLEGLAVGEKVMFTLKVNFAANRVEVTEISGLPEDTKLVF